MLVYVSKRFVVTKLIDNMISNIIQNIQSAPSYFKSVFNSCTSICKSIYTKLYNLPSYTRIDYVNELLNLEVSADDLEVDPLVLKLMQSIYVENTKGNDYLKDLSSKLNYELHKVITESHLIRQLLSYVTDNSDVGIYIDSTSCDKDDDGRYDLYAAKKIAINSSNKNITRTINHELTHQAIDLFFKNFCHPFSKDDLATKKALKALIDSNIDKGDDTWFSSNIYFDYEENKYDIELFTWLVSLLTEKILNPEKTIYDSQGFTAKVWEEFQKIVKLMMEKDGKEFVPEPAPEVYEFSQESQEVPPSKEL